MLTAMAVSRPERLPAQTPPAAVPGQTAVRSIGGGKPANFYNSQISGNDFNGTKTLAAVGFTDVHGGVASFRGGNLVLTPDQTSGGTDAFTRGCVLREAPNEQARDMGCRVVLPPDYRTGGATIGLLLRFQPNAAGLLLNFAPDADPSLIAYTTVGATANRCGSASLAGRYEAANPVALEARVIVGAAMTLTATDLTTGHILGFLSVPLDAGSYPAGAFGLVPWMMTPGKGSVEVASVQTYPVTAVVCDGDSLTYGENASTGKGTASPLATNYPGVLQKLLGNRYHVFNLGRSGFTLAQMNSDAASRVDALVAHAERPPIVVLEGGTNDFGIDGSIKPPISVAQAVQTVYGRLQTYWAARHAARADTLVVDVANTPAAHPVYIGRDGNDQNPTYFNPGDKTHLLDPGYAAKAAVVAAAIQQSGGSVTR